MNRYLHSSVLLLLVGLLLGNADAFSQTRRLRFGVAAGSGIVCNSYKNLLSWNKEIGSSVVYSIGKSKLELQGNYFWCQRSIQAVTILFNDVQSRGVYWYKPYYNTNEFSLNVNYLVFKDVKQSIKVGFGIGYNLYKIRVRKERYLQSGRVFSWSSDVFNQPWNRNKVQSLCFSLGVAADRTLGRKEIPYRVSLQFQKSLKRAPTFSYTGDIILNGNFYHQSLSMTPYLDALSLRFTLFLFAINVN